MDVLPNKYTCDFCNFFTKNKRDFTRHETTKKHLCNINHEKLNIGNDYTCNLCNKNFTSTKKSTHISSVADKQNAIILQLVEQINKLNDNVKQNTELINQNKKLIDCLKNSTKKIYNTINNITINQYSNTTTRDTVNFSDFFTSLLDNISVDSIKHL